jgi:uncharacterized membrane protein YfhO
MNRDIEILIVISVASFVAELLWVPFDVHLPNELTRGLGYAFIFSPPEVRGPGEAVVRWEQVAVELLVTTFVVAMWYLLVRHILEDLRSR